MLHYCHKLNAVVALWGHKHRVRDTTLPPPVDNLWWWVDWRMFRINSKSNHKCRGCSKSVPWCLNSMKLYGLRWIDRQRGLEVEEEEQREWERKKETFIVTLSSLYWNWPEGSAVWPIQLWPVSLPRLRQPEPQNKTTLQHLREQPQANQTQRGWLAGHRDQPWPSFCGCLSVSPIPATYKGVLPNSMENQNILDSKWFKVVMPYS